MRSIAGLVLVAMLAGCSGGDGGERAGPTYDASLTPPPSDSVRVNFAPVAKITLDTIRLEDTIEADLTGVGCVFVPKGNKDTDWAVITGDGDAHIRRNGRFVAFKADQTTRDMGYLSREIYKGDGLSMQLVHALGEPTPAGNEGEERAGAVIIRDAQGDTVWRADGQFNCGA